MKSRRSQGWRRGGEWGDEKKPGMEERRGGERGDEKKSVMKERRGMG